MQGEIDFNEKIIQERQENLDAAEAIAVATRDIAITINQKVHEQREDLVEINQNVEVAKENAEEAE